jgi:hypothetical protein
VEASLAQLVGGVAVQTHHLGSNPHEHEFRFLFILEDHAFLGLMQFILRTRLHIYSRLKILTPPPQFLIDINCQRIPDTTTGE